jgi:hypothetical protein
MWRHRLKQRAIAARQSRRLIGFSNKTASCALTTPQPGLNELRRRSKARFQGKFTSFGRRLTDNGF